MSRTAQQWDAAYAERAAHGRTLWTAGPNATVAAVLADRLPGSAVDVAAGEGRHALWLAERGWQVTAVDFSAVGLDLAAREAAARGLGLATVRADVTGWEPTAPVDLVLCAYLHLPSPASGRLLDRLGGWLAPGGWLVTLGHDRANLERGVGGPQDPDVLWDAAMLRAAASGAGLEVIRAEQVRRPVEGESRPALDVLQVARRADQAPPRSGTRPGDGWGYSTMAVVRQPGAQPSTPDGAVPPSGPAPGPVSSAEAAAALSSRALEAAGAGILVADPTGRVVVANRTALGWLAVTEVGDLRANRLGRVQILTADQAGPMPGRRLPLTRALRGEHVDQLELVLVGPDGSRRRVRVSADPMLEPDGTLVGAVIVGCDVTTPPQVDPQAERGVITQLSAMAVARRAVLADADPRQAVARAIVAVTGAASATVMEVHGEMLQVTASAGPDVAPLQLRLDQPSVVRAAYESGRSRMVGDVRTDPQLDTDALDRLETSVGVRIGAGCWAPVLADRRVLGVLTALFAVDAPPLDDHTTVQTMELLASEAGLAIERDDLRRRLTAQAMSDELTGLANLRAWRAALARMPRRGGLAIIDLDHFKSVNDQAGHAAGDRVLHDFALAMRSRTRAEDLVARIGGEEFAVLCPVGRDVAVLIARLQARWQEVTRDHPVPVTFSAGVAARAPEEPPERTQARADKALYAAKQTGRDRCLVAAGDEHRAG